MSCEVELEAPTAEKTRRRPVGSVEQRRRLELRPDRGVWILLVLSSGHSSGGMACAKILQ